MSEMVTTRRSLHALAELALAGPQFASNGTIALSVTPEGIATVREPIVMVTLAGLVVDGRTIPVHDRTIDEVAAEAGLVARTLADVYSDGCGLDANHRLQIEPSAAAEILAAFRSGNDALVMFAPDERRVLWPEHFDLGITRDEVNYGVSPGDDFLPVPYAYVGPWARDSVDGQYWNTPFGAARPVSEFDDPDAIVEFFREGQSSTS